MQSAGSHHVVVIFDCINFWCHFSRLNNAVSSCLVALIHHSAASNVTGSRCTQRRKGAVIHLVQLRGAWVRVAVPAMTHPICCNKCYSQSSY